MLHFQTGEQHIFKIKQVHENSQKPFISYTNIKPLMYK
jgi:hypothetical protein